MLAASGYTGAVRFRIDSAYYAIELLVALRKARARFTVSAPRTQAMWRRVGQIAEDAWTEAQDLEGAQVAEIAYTPDGWTHEPLRLIIRRTQYTAAQLSGNLNVRRRKTIHPEQLALLTDGQTTSPPATASFSQTSTAARPSGSSTSTATARRSKNAPSSAKRCDACLAATTTTTACG